jgi:hypothetical protein
MSLVSARRSSPQPTLQPLAVAGMLRPPLRRYPYRGRSIPVTGSCPDRCGGSQTPGTGGFTGMPRPYDPLDTSG